MATARYCSTCKCPLTLLRTGKGNRREERFKCARCCEKLAEPTLVFKVAMRPLNDPPARRLRIVAPPKE